MRGYLGIVSGKHFRRGFVAERARNYFEYLALRAPLVFGKRGGFKLVKLSVDNIKVYLFKTGYEYALVLRSVNRFFVVPKLLEQLFAGAQARNLYRYILLGYKTVYAY